MHTGCPLIWGQNFSYLTQNSEINCKSGSHQLAAWQQNTKRSSTSLDEIMCCKPQKALQSKTPGSLWWGFQHKPSVTDRRFAAEGWTTVYSPSLKSSVNSVTHEFCWSSPESNTHFHALQVCIISCSRLQVDKSFVCSTWLFCWHWHNKDVFN